MSKAVKVVTPSRENDSLSPLQCLQRKSFKTWEKDLFYVKLAQLDINI